MAIQWLVEATGNSRFPFRIAIEQGSKTIFAVRAQDAWPGPKGHIFCIRDGSLKEERDLFVEKERIPVLQFERFGKSLRILLDRPTRKRCEFLIIEKPYKTKEGAYEQIFFRTQAGIHSHKSKSRVALQPTAVPLQVAIDVQERYPWRFPKADVRRMKLPAGDYALLRNETIAAVVERKTFDNFLTDIGSIVTLHQSLNELSTYPFAALVIEANYGDFLDPARLDGRWPASHGYRIMAELQAMHPRLPIIFARTRKEANLWTYGFFRAVAKLLTQKGKEGETLLTQEPVFPYERGERLEERLLGLLADAPDGMTLEELAGLCSDAGATVLQRTLQRLRERGTVTRTGRAKTARWICSRAKNID